MYLAIFEQDKFDDKVVKIIRMFKENEQNANDLMRGVDENGEALYLINTETNERYIGNGYWVEIEKLNSLDELWQ